MKNIRKTVTVGIPAHNEQNNIAQLLEGVLSQKGNSFLLTKVVVLCDGCTDKTVSIVSKYKKKNKKIELRDDGLRVGKTSRLNELFTSTNTDICITFDADIKLNDVNVIEELVKKFRDKNIGLVGGSNLPLPPKSFFEKVVVAWLILWYEVRKNYNNGNTIHNHLGCITAMSRSLYKKTIIPLTISADDDYLYFNALTQNYKFAHAAHAKVYFRSASTLKDFFLQHSRFLTLKNNIHSHYGNWVNNYYYIPIEIKLKILIKEFLKNPFYLSLSVILQLLLLIHIKFTKFNYSNGMWKIAISSKQI